MADDNQTTEIPDDPHRRAKTPQAQRALDEAQARREHAVGADRTTPAEINGRPGPEPVRFGDWENKGIASDF